MNNIAQILMVESSVPHLALLPVCTGENKPCREIPPLWCSCAISSTPFTAIILFQFMAKIDHIFAVIFSLSCIQSLLLYIFHQRDFPLKTKPTKKLQLTLEQQGLTMQLLNLHEDFCSIVNTTWFMVGWICRYRTSDMEGPWIRQANCKLYSDFDSKRKISAPCWQG